MKLGTPEVPHLSKLARAEAIFYMNGTSIARNQAPKNIEQNGYSLLIRLRQGERALLQYSQNFPLSVRTAAVKASMKSISKPRLMSVLP